MKQRRPIAVAGVFLQRALGAVYALPNGDRERVPMRVPAAAR